MSKVTVAAIQMTYGLETAVQKVEEAAALIRSCMEAQPFPEFDVPIVAEAAFGPSFGELAEMEVAR